MCTAWPHVAIIIHATNEHAQFCGIARMIHMKDTINFLFPRLQATRSKPVTKPVSFFDGPLLFDWVNGESVFAQAMQNGG
jgi:hypothetical protein